MRARRLLVVSDEMEVGGSQRQIVHLLRGLDRDRWAPTLLYFRNRSFLVDELDAAGIPALLLPKRHRIDLEFVFKLIRFLRKHRFEAIHCLSVTAETWIRAVLPFVPQCAFIVSVRGLCLGYRPWQWQLKRWILARADAVISNAHAGARMTAMRTGFPIERIRVVANGIDLPDTTRHPEPNHLRTELELRKDSVFGLFVGRIVVEKNLSVLVRAVALIDPEHRPVLFLAGSGPLEAELREQIRTCGVGQSLRLLGERSDARELMLACDFLVLPSREEGMSNVLLEAMAAGRAVLASNVGGNPELVDDENTGLLFENNSEHQLAEQLLRLTEDAGLRNSLGAAARSKAERDFSLAALVRDSEAVYSNALSARGIR